jgi:hypothetical protein
MVTNQQLYLAIGVPLLFQTMLIGLVVLWANAKFEALEAKFEGRFAVLEARMSALETRLAALEQVWRAELRRVEEILDARLKHLEERL